jgi:hypothetical protein
MITSTVKADGADLYVERRRDGPPLLSAEFAEFPGGHLALMELPVPFAAGLRDVFGRL